MKANRLYDRNSKCSDPSREQTLGCVRIPRRDASLIIVVLLSAFLLTLRLVYVGLRLDTQYFLITKNPHFPGKGGNITTITQRSKKIRGSQDHNDRTDQDALVLGACHPVENQTGTDILLNATLGSWSNDEPLPEWVHQLCPEVVDHYRTFPLFRDFITYRGAVLPTPSTAYAAKAACTLSIVRQLAASVGITLHLCAGSHLGAMVHGQGIPWDDDVDAIIPLSDLPAFRGACSGGVRIHGSAQLVCREMFNAIKVYVEYDGMTASFVHPKSHRYKAPFIDLFASRIEGNSVVEVRPDGRDKLKKLAWPMDVYYPVQPYYYAGLVVMGPNPDLARHRYKLDRCFLNGRSHRVKDDSIMNIAQVLSNHLELDCCRLSRVLPFVHTRGGIPSIQNGQSTVRYLPTNLTIPRERLAAFSHADINR